MFHTFIKVTNFSPEEITHYKSTHENYTIKWDRIKINLPEWFVQETHVMVDAQGKTNFSEILKKHSATSKILLDFAKSAALSDKNIYDLTEEEEGVLLNALSKDKTCFTLNVDSTKETKDIDIEKFYYFVIYTLLKMDTETAEKVIRASKEDLIKFGYLEGFEKIQSLVNSLFYWVCNLSSDNLKKEILMNLNAKTHFIREYINWMVREFVKGTYAFVEYREGFEGVLCPLDYSTRKIKEAIEELEERKICGTIYFDEIEVLGYYRFQNNNEFIKGGLIRIRGLVKSEYPICFVFKMRSLSTEDVIKELSLVRNPDEILIPEAYKSILGVTRIQK